MYCRFHLYITAVGISTQEYMRENCFPQPAITSSSSHGNIAGAAVHTGDTTMGDENGGGGGLDENPRAFPSSTSLSWSWPFLYCMGTRYMHTICMAARRFQKSCCSCQPISPTELNYVRLSVSADAYAQSYSGGFKLDPVSDD